MASTLRFGLFARPATSSLLLAQPSTTISTACLAAAASATATPSSATSASSIIPADTRAFSTTRTLLATGYPRQGIPRDTANLPIPKPHARDTHIPAYPYGPRPVYKQSNAGLYAGARIQFGNNVTPKHNVKTHRKWRPNVQRKRLWSPALRCFVQTRVTTRVLRTIDKVGGLDEYLLGDKAQRIKDLGPWGWKLRWRLMQSETVKERFLEQRKKLGLVPRTRAEIEEQVKMEREAAAVMAQATDDAARLALQAETDRMLDAGEEFALGNDKP
ncbi:hypothetical protein BD289DRAFT_443779 [Coniella lustricola]|uniref:Large ribosomal subunit protein bL28m n=1 Tax=Coniella lustricola TaxID=2025994 RepID=A0A2T2ZWN2_9PEZI|nr:hypothetical protein BD289DRAFT_443779 [Coniella lustricola]